MKKIVMFFGSDRAFVERIPKTYRNLSDIAMQMDDENKQMQLVLVGLPGNENAPSKTKKCRIRFQASQPVLLSSSSFLFE